METDFFEQKAELLSMMANAQRLRMLTVISDGEISVGPLATKVGLSQSALSQHLAKLRAAGMVSTRREAQTVFYSIESEHVAIVLTMLSNIFRAEEAALRVAGATRA